MWKRDDKPILSGNWKIFSQWLLEFKKKIILSFHIVYTKTDSLEFFVWLYYSVLKSTLNNDLIITTQPKGVQRHFEEVQRMYSAEKKTWQKIFYTRFKTIKLIKKLSSSIIVYFNQLTCKFCCWHKHESFHKLFLDKSSFPGFFWRNGAQKNFRKFPGAHTWRSATFLKLVTHW